MNRAELLEFLKRLIKVTPDKLKIEVEEIGRGGNVMTEIVITIGQKVPKGLVIVEYTNRGRWGGKTTRIRYKTLEAATLDSFVQKVVERKREELEKYIEKHS